MTIEEITKKIIDDMAEANDAAIAKAFTLHVTNLLRANGIDPILAKIERYPENTSLDKFQVSFGYAFYELDTSEHDAEIRRQTIAEFLIKLHEIMDEKEKEYGVACIESNCDALAEFEEWLHEKMKGETE